MSSQFTVTNHFGRPSPPLYMETCPLVFTTHCPQFSPHSHLGSLSPDSLSPSIVIPTESLKFDGFTFLVPKLDHITSPPETKDRCLVQTVQAINLSGANPQTKFLALSSRFQHLPLAAKHTQNKLIGLQDLRTPAVPTPKS